MATAGAPDLLAELARRVDVIAGRVRPWQIGHELARELTSDGPMTAQEVAVVQALERTLDWDTDVSTRDFRVWWLDEDTALAEIDPEWPVAWAAAAEAATHPTVVAHLSDLLWSVRHGTAHLHARRAVDAYLDAAELLQESHDRCRSLIRAHELARAINDVDRLTVTETRICDSAAAELAKVNLGSALALLEDLCTRRISDAAAEKTDELLDLAWQTASRTDHVERLAKLILRRVHDDSARAEVSARVVTVFRGHAEQQEGFGRLMALRETLRIAEEFGDPSHDEILNEIETFDSESAFKAIRTEQVLSRDHIAAFCAQVVGDDSLEHALIRFAGQICITPESVQNLRDSTTVGVRHLVTNVRIGEANSVVTSSETSSADMDPLVAAVERDVLQMTGFQAQATSFLFLVPALHQTLASYRPWTIGDVRGHLEAGLADAVVADAIARSLDHFHHRRYDEAVHVALPRVERLIRHIARSCGVATTRRPTKRVGGVRGLGEILVDLRNDGEAPILPEPLLTAAELTLVDPDSLNLRNEFMHGISDEVRPGEAALVLQLGLALALTIRLDRRGSDHAS